MSSISIAPPNDISDVQLVFGEDETRRILVFFWPYLSSKINALNIDTEVRRFAQSILIAAIDASYAMGFVHKLFTTITNPRGGLKAMGKKLARSYVKHWWKHTKQTDLQDARIYETVRNAVAGAYGPQIRMFIEEQVLTHIPCSVLHVARATGSKQVWAETWRSAAY
jgi:hypothetical protein